MDLITIHTDGGARGNPGPAGFAFVLSRPGQPDLEENGYLGEATNNVAEYTAVVRALERARAIGARRVLLKSDSELMVKQMNGQYKVKNAGLLPLFEQAQRLRRDFDQVTFQHVRREYNKEADKLANDAMDFRRSTVSGSPPPETASAPSSPTPSGERAEKAGRTSSKKKEKWDRARTAGIARLEAAFPSASGNGTAARVWEDLIAILRENGILKPATNSDTPV